MNRNGKPSISYLRFFWSFRWLIQPSLPFWFSVTLLNHIYRENLTDYLFSSQVFSGKFLSNNCNAFTFNNFFFFLLEVQTICIRKPVSVMHSDVTKCIDNSLSHFFFVLFHMILLSDSANLCHIKNWMKMLPICNMPHSRLMEQPLLLCTKMTFTTNPESKKTMLFGKYKVNCPFFKSFIESRVLFPKLHEMN